MLCVCVCVRARACVSVSLCIRACVIRDVEQLAWRRKEEERRKLEIDKVSE